MLARQPPRNISLLRLMPMPRKVDWNNIETTYPVLKPYLDKVGTKVDEVSDQKTSAPPIIAVN